MDIVTPIEFSEAIDQWLARVTLPTGLDSATIKQQISAAIRRQSVFSAETMMEGYLDRIQSTLASVIQPKQELRTDETGATKTVTTGHNPATAREALRNALRSEGYRPAEDIKGTIKDLSSDARLNLVVKTNTDLAQGAGKYVQSNLDEDVIELYPAWELVRYEKRSTPRDWEQRWRIAAQVAGDAQANACLGLYGRMCALKSSEIWEQLGEGAGGYTDTLDNPYPPFAFNSGMWTDDVSRDDAQSLGLLEEGDQVKPKILDIAKLFGLGGES